MRQQSRCQHHSEPFEICKNKIQGFVKAFDGPGVLCFPAHGVLSECMFLFFSLAKFLRDFADCELSFFCSRFSRENGIDEGAEASGDRLRPQAVSNVGVNRLLRPGSLFEALLCIVISNKIGAARSLQLKRPDS